MDRRIFHGKIEPNDIAQALAAEFSRGNMLAQIAGSHAKLAVQISTRMGAQSGGQTALTITIQQTDDGVMIEIGQQAWLGVAASLGETAISALRNPFSILGRLDDLAQDIENIQLGEKVWQVIDHTIARAGASYALSDRLRRITCEYCLTANPVGESSCIACGAPLGNEQPASCPHCGFAVSQTEGVCPNCSNRL